MPPLSVLKRVRLHRIGYLRQQDIPLVIVSHDREFLDQLCTKIVETEFGKATTYKGNYTQYVQAKSEKAAMQWAAYEKQQKEIARQVRLAQPGQAWLLIWMSPRLWGCVLGEQIEELTFLLQGV